MQFICGWYGYGWYAIIDAVDVVDMVDMVDTGTVGMVDAVDTVTVDRLHTLSRDVDQVVHVDQVVLVTAKTSFGLFL